MAAAVALLALVCPYCGCAVSVNRDERSPGCGDIECSSCAAAWSGLDGGPFYGPVGAQS